MSFLKRSVVALVLFVGLGSLMQKLKPSPSNWMEPGGSCFHWVLSSRMWTSLLLGWKR